MRRHGVCSLPEFSKCCLSAATLWRAVCVAGLDCGTHQHQTLDNIPLEGVNRAGDGEVSLTGTSGASAEGDVVLLDVLQIKDLVGRAPVQIRATRAQQWRRVVDGRGVCRRHRRLLSGELDQPELHVVDGERLLSLRVKAPQRSRGAFPLRQSTTNREARATTCDGDVERGFDLAQICVERAAKVGERSVIDWSELQFDGLRFAQVARMPCS